MANIVFVDEHDQVIGAGSKDEALERGYIVRIVRIFLQNEKGELLLQKRSQNVQAPGLWDQSVGGHVDEGEDYIDAAHREMKEELGIAGVELKQISKYRSDVSLIPGFAKRFNMLYSGSYDGEIDFDLHEVETVRWIEPDALADEMKRTPDLFTKGMVHAFEILRDLGELGRR